MLRWTDVYIDVVTEYAFGRSYGRLDMDDFDPTYAQSMHEGTAASHLNKQFIWAFRALLALPDWLAAVVAPGLSLYVSFIRDCEKQIAAIQKAYADRDGWLKRKRSPDYRTTIFHELLENESLPAREKSMRRLVQEGQIIVSAGTETTAWCLSVLTFHLLSNPTILERLQDELERAIPNPSKSTPLAQLEQLPYLTACIQEGLRLSYGVSGRLQRISPENPLVFNDGKKDWVIPARVRSHQLPFFFFQVQLRP
jgi:cytochrome P450